MQNYFTSGQVCKKLRISISTLKRWLDEPDLNISERRNYNGWRLFSDSDVETLKEFKRNIRKNGKRFKTTTFIPVTLSDNK
ncbi:MAG: MerR family transcriptional regulator [Fibrobacter sp.]|nr:MerR family transcriptional regulator [Fibrobacter sp.]